MIGRGSLALLTAALALVGCTADPAPGPDVPVTTEPPPPPAACLLDADALAAGTGLRWTPDEATAGDTRCVYDPEGGTGREFVTVEITPLTPADAAEPAATLDTVAALCDDGTRAPVGVDGFVCRFQGGSVFAARVRDGRLVTVSSSGVPAGTTAEQLGSALAGQLG